MEELAQKYARELTSRSFGEALAFLRQLHPELDAASLQHIVLLAHQNARDNAVPSDKARKGKGIYF